MEDQTYLEFLQNSLEPFGSTIISSSPVIGMVNVFLDMEAASRMRFINHQVSIVIVANFLNPELDTIFLYIDPSSTCK